jgi:hypothetical protein
MSYYKRHETAKPRWKERNHYERHYCELCNVWLASDRSSILHHENGAQHQLQLQQSTLDQRERKEQHEKEQKIFQSSLQHMEAAAVASVIGQDYARFATTTATKATATAPTTTAFTTIVPSTNTNSAATAAAAATATTTTTTQASKVEWEERKRKRQEEKRVAAQARAKELGHRLGGPDSNDNDDDDNDNDNDDDESMSTKKQRQRQGGPIGETEGSYEIDGVTWLEGTTYGEIIEDEMPVQLWRGPNHCTDVELRLPHHTVYWRDAIVVAVRPVLQYQQHQRGADRIVLDVAYLEQQQQPQQHDQDQGTVQPEVVAEERIVKSVPLRHVRIQLGNPADDPYQKHCWKRDCSPWAAKRFRWMLLVLPQRRH